MFQKSPLRCACVSALSLVVACGAASRAGAQTPPQSVVDTTPVQPTGRTLHVPAGGSFQAALNQAQPGDQITLEAGATFAGRFTLPAKSGSSPITIRTSAPDSSLPPAGVRITPAYASVLPKIVATDAGGAILTLRGARNYRFLGLEVTVAANVSSNWGLILLGDGVQTSAADAGGGFVLDRLYIHGNSTVNLVRGVALNSGSAAVVNSYISDVDSVTNDAQAICGWNGPGPYKIANNYLEASGENVLFGGEDPRIYGLVPSDIEILGNHLSKPLTWKIGDPSYAGTPWLVKNLLELKNAQRVVIDGNVLERSWPQGQNGFGILLTPRNQSGTAPWSVVQDVAITHNIVRFVAGGVNILGTDDSNSSQPMRRVLIQHNVFEQIPQATSNGGRLFQVLNGPADLRIDHNTSLQSGDPVVAAMAPALGFVFTNNLTMNGPSGVAGEGTFGNPMLTLTQFFPNATFVANALIGGRSTSYPSGNYFPSSTAAVQFADEAAGIYQLKATSPMKGRATDGTDIGVDWTALTTATSGAISGQPGTGTAAPTPAPAPAPAPARTPDPRIALDSPQSGPSGSSFRVAGWAVDLGAASGGGVDAVHVYAFPSANGGFGAGIFLGSPAASNSRTDVGAVFGSQFSNSGYGLDVSSLAAGTYRIVVYAHSTVTGTFSAQQHADITIGGSASQPAMALDGAANGSTVAQPFVLGGWAVDRGASSGSGVDTIHVWAFPTNGGPAVFVGVVAYGGARADVGAAFGSRFTNSGYTLIVNSLPRGVTYDIGVYAHSTVSGTFNQVRFLRLTVQ